MSGHTCRTVVLSNAAWTLEIASFLEWFDLLPLASTSKTFASHSYQGVMWRRAAVHLLRLIEPPLNFPLAWKKELLCHIQGVRKHLDTLSTRVQVVAYVRTMCFFVCHECETQSFATPHPDGRLVRYFGRTIDTASQTDVPICVYCYWSHCAWLTWCPSGGAIGSLEDDRVDMQQKLLCPDCRTEHRELCRDTVAMARDLPLRRVRAVCVEVTMSSGFPNYLQGCMICGLDADTCTCRRLGGPPVHLRLQEVEQETTVKRRRV